MKEIAKIILARIAFTLIFGILLIIPIASASHITWEPTNGPKGDYSRYIVQDSTNLNTLYVGFGPSQIWKSTDGGETWVQKNKGLPEIEFFGGVAAEGISALAISEKNPKTLYAGTITGNIYKTTDGSENWKKVFSVSSDEAYSIQIIKVSPHDNSQIFAGTINGMFYVSRDAGNTWNEVNGLKFIKGSASGDIAFDPVDESVIYFAPSYFDVEEEGKGSGLFKSTDKGETWKKIGQGLETEIVNKIAINPKNIKNIFLAVGSSFGWGYGTHGVYESVDGGEIFSKVREDFIPFQHATPYIAFSRDGQRLIVGGHPGGEDFFISEDNGKTWQTKTGLWGDFVADVAQFDDPNKFLVSLYWSSLFLTKDGGNTWQDIKEFYGSKLHAVYAPNFDKDRVYAAAHSNGLFYSDDKGLTWNRVEESGGIIHEAIVHNYESSASRFAPDLLWIRGEFSSEAIILKNPVNPVWKKIDVPGDMNAILAHPNVGKKAFVGSDKGLSLADYDSLKLSKILDDVEVNFIDGNENIIAVGTNKGVYISDNQGKNFSKIGLDGKIITAVGVNDNEIYAAVENDGVYLNSAGTFNKINSLILISQILVDPGNENNVYFAKSSEFGVSEIYFSDNKGKSPVLEENGLKQSPTFDPHKLAFSGDGTFLYLATNGQGVWKAKIRDNPIEVLEPIKTGEEREEIINKESEPTPKTTNPQDFESNTKEIISQIFKKAFWPIFIIVFIVILTIIGIKIYKKREK